MLRAARWLAFSSAVAVVFSIAVSQILLALAFVALLLSGAKLRLPPVALPLGLFLLGTLISLAFSGDPATGLPQVRKMFVFLELLVVFSVLRDIEWIRWLFQCWAGFSAVVAIRGLVQFGNKLDDAHAQGRNFYDFYMSERITGTMSHWMTFSGQEMFALLMLLSFLFFAPGARRRAWIWMACGAVIAVTLVLGFTRSMWIATAAGALYLTWFWRRALVAVAPVAVVIAFLLSPPYVKERVQSVFQPRKGVDSNEFRFVTWRTGLQMIRQHPFVGIGPEQVKVQFNRYVPAEIPRPLPIGWYGHLHNIYLHYAAERGVPTMLCLVWALIQILVDCFRRLQRLPPGRSDVKFLLHGAIAVVIGTMIAGCFELNLGDSEVLTMFLIVTACAYVPLEAEPVLEEERAVA